MLLVEITPASHPIELALAYATPNNVTGRPVYGRAACFLHPEAVAALEAAARLVEDGTLAGMKDARYAGWDGPLGQEILGGGTTLAGLAGRVASGEIDPVRASGRQERYENVVNEALWPR